MPKNNLFYNTPLTNTHPTHHTLNNTIHSVRFSLVMMMYLAKEQIYTIVLVSP
jgi:hypothetical protein